MTNVDSISSGYKENPSHNENHKHIHFLRVTIQQIDSFNTFSHFKPSNPFLQVYSTPNLC